MARIKEDFQRFNYLANLFTGRSDLNFTNYQDAKTFSCTFEMERMMNRQFCLEIDTMYDCLSECQLETSTDAFSIVRFTPYQLLTFLEFQKPLLQKMPYGIE